MVPMEHLLRYVPSRAALLAVSPVVNQKFFERNPGLTEQICLEQAAQILDCPASSLRPAALQGASSFTVARVSACPGDLGVVQFRDLSSELRRDTIALARRTYGDLVPRCDVVLCGLSNQAHVYLMTVVGGIAFGAAQRTLYEDDSDERLTVTIAHFASFIASSLSTARQNTDDAALTQAQENLAAWEAALPTRFHPKLAQARARLPVLFGRAFPQVLNHADLVEMNIHVDELAPGGGITGVVDWERAAYGPFGVALASLELFLGISTAEGVWIWHPRRDRLRAVFYETLCAELGRGAAPLATRRHLGANDVEAARIFGLFSLYGDWAAVEASDGGPAPIAACLEAGLGEEAAAQPFLRQFWGGDCGGDRL